MHGDEEGKGAAPKPSRSMQHRRRSHLLLVGLPKAPGAGRLGQATSRFPRLFECLDVIRGGGARSSECAAAAGTQQQTPWHDAQKWRDCELSSSHCALYSKASPGPGVQRGSPALETRPPAAAAFGACCQPTAVGEETLIAKVSHQQSETSLSLSLSARLSPPPSRHGAPCRRSVFGGVSHGMSSATARSGSTRGRQRGKQKQK